MTEPMLTSQREDAVVYRGDGEKFARRLSKVIHGGQVVLSEIAWASIQDQIPGQSQVIQLGICLYSECNAGFVYGGQAVLNDKGWASIQDQIIGHSQLCIRSVEHMSYT